MLQHKQIFCGGTSLLRDGMEYPFRWFSLKWCQRLQLSIAIKELIPVVFAAAIWGKFWSGKIVLFNLDNLAVVEAINFTFCKDLHLMHLVRLLVFLTAHIIIFGSVQSI